MTTNESLKIALFILVIVLVLNIMDLVLGVTLMDIVDQIMFTFRNVGDALTHWADVIWFF